MEGTFTWLVDWLGVGGEGEERNSDSKGLFLGDTENGGEVGNSTVGADFGEDEFGFGQYFVHNPLTQRT